MFTAILGAVVICRCEEAEQSVRFTANASREEQPIAWSSGVVIAESKGPKTVVLQRMSIRISQKIIEASAVGVIDGNLSATCISDQQMIAYEAEVRGCQRDAPWSVQPRAVLQSLQQLPLWREFVHKTLAWEVCVIVLAGILLRICYVETPIYLLHVEGRKTGRDLMIMERSVIIIADTAKIDQLEVGVIDFYPTGSKVGDVQKTGPARCHLSYGCSLVNGTFLRIWDGRIIENLYCISLSRPC